MAGRHDGNAKVNEAAFVLDAETAVLRDATFRNVQIAEHLDARNDGRMPVFRNGRHCVLQDAVNSVLHGDFSVTCFNENVARAALKRGKDDGLDEFDDRAGGGIAGDTVAGKCFVFLIDGFVRLQSKGFGGLFENALRLFGALEDVADLAGGGDLDGKFFAEKQLQFVGQGNLTRLGHGNG